MTISHIITIIHKSLYFRPKNEFAKIMLKVLFIQIIQYFRIEVILEKEKLWKSLFSLE